VKTLVIGLDCAAPEILFGHPELPNIKELMRRGCYGRLESVIPPITVPAWILVHWVYTDFGTAQIIHMAGWAL